jgi:hypothetical protein
MMALETISKNEIAAQTIGLNINLILRCPYLTENSIGIAGGQTDVLGLLGEENEIIKVLVRGELEFCLSTDHADGNLRNL